LRSPTPTHAAPLVAPNRVDTPPRPIETTTPASLVVAPNRVDAPPRPIETLMPVYPERALKERARGIVVLRVLVSEAGLPLEIKVVKGARADLTKAAIAAAKQWRFEPALKDGRPVRTFTTIRFPFEGVQFARTPFPGAESGGFPRRTPTRAPGDRP
jgi:protein TonB